VGDLLSAHEKTKAKREILLSITPHIVKKVEMPMEEVARIWSGGEDDLQAGSRFGAFAAPLEAEVQQTPPAPVPARAPGRVPSVSPAPAAPLQLPEDAPAPELPPQPAAPVPPPASSATAPVPGMRLFFTDPGQGLVGAEMALTVRVAGMENLHSAPLFVRYDPERLEFLRALEGDFLRAAGHPTVFSTAGNPKRGEVIIGHKQQDQGRGASGEGNLFQLFFRGRTPGPARVVLDRLNFRDPDGKQLDVGSVETLVHVRQP
jgi:general secretion pathway protein D